MKSSTKTPVTAPATGDSVLAPVTELRAATAQPPDAEPMVRLRGATRTFGSGETAVHALNHVDVDIARGQYVVLLGPSGSGKTTLLNAIGGIDTLTSGAAMVDGATIGDLDSRKLTEFRRDHVAFVFQLFNLVPTLTALENVQLIAGLTGGDGKRATAALSAVGLAEQLDRFPSELSGGQQQRVAVARALAKETPLLLCDEPTGALDQASGQQVLGLLDELHEQHGRTIILVTHDESIARRADRVIRMVDGRIVEDAQNSVTES